MSRNSYRNWKASLWAVIFCLVWTLAGSAQATQPLPQRGERLTVEGELTHIQTKGQAIFEIQTAEGNAYRIQVPFGMSSELSRAGFDPQVGQKIRVTGEVLCVLAETPVVAASEITFHGKTYRMPPPSS